jgi:ATP:ADP antiporter, AAA family
MLEAEHTKTVPITRATWLRVAIGALCFFCILFSYYLIRPIREGYSATAGGSAALPRLFAIVFLTMLVLTPIYGALVARFSRRVFVPVIYLLFIASFFGLKWFVEQGYSVSANATLIFVYLSVFNLFVVSVFWSCMADAFTHTHAKRFFGYIAVGGSLGAICGPLALGPILTHLGKETAYVFSGVTMMIALGCILSIFYLSRNDPAADKGEDVEAPVGGGVFAGAQAVFADPFLRTMVLLMLCGDAVATILYANLSDYAKSTFADSEATTLFFRNVDLYANIASAAMQGLVAAACIKRFGAGKTMALPNIIGAILLFGIAGTQAVSLIVVAMVFSRGGTYGLVVPARESLFARVDREQRFKAKNFIDTAIWRLGDVIMVSMVWCLVQLGAGTRTFASICAVAACVAAYASWRIEQKLPQGAQAPQP